MSSPIFSVRLQTIEDCLTDAAFAEEPATKRAAIERGMRAAQRLLETHRDHYQTYHALGVLWYHHPDKSSERTAKVKELLSHALALNPDSQFSIQYLAYIHFDERDYRTA